MSIYQGLILVGDLAEDNGGTAYRWGTLVSKAPKTIEGEDVTNPASILLYGSADLEPGSMARLVVVCKGIPGLYTVVADSSVDTLLYEMDMESVKDFPEIPVVESDYEPLTREERKTRRESRRQKREAAQSATTSTPLVEDVV